VTTFYDFVDIAFFKGRHRVPEAFQDLDVSLKEVIGLINQKLFHYLKLISS
jgi:hypothetical protein